MQGVSAFILAGGKSSRMGADKAFLEFEGRTLLARALQLAGSVASQVFIVGAREKFQAYGAVVEDVYSDCGPLAGIHAALRASSSELNLVLAVDMPFLDGAFLRWLLGEARASATLACVPLAGGRAQTLCAVYRRAFADAAEAALQHGRNKIDPLYASVPTRLISEDEVRAAGFEPRIFDNVNTPEEYAQATRRHPRP